MLNFWSQVKYGSYFLIKELRQKWDSYMGKKKLINLNFMNKKDSRFDKWIILSKISQ